MSVAICKTAAALFLKTGVVLALLFIALLLALQQMLLRALALFAEQLQAKLVCLCRGSAKASHHVLARACDPTRLAADRARLADAEAAANAGFLGRKQPLIGANECDAHT